MIKMCPKDDHRPHTAVSFNSRGQRLRSEVRYIHFHSTYETNYTTV